MIDRNEILANYAAGPDRLEAAIAGLSPAGLEAALSSDSWSIRQIVHHVVDGDDLWKTFIKQAIGIPDSEFILQWYWEMEQVAWGLCWAYAERAIEPSLALLRANRAHIVQLLEHAPTAWETCLLVRWPQREAQKVSVAWVVDLQARHVVGHAADILRIREAHHL